ncbi:hypothetical protein AQUCO_10400005v1 [Aquilegia coerulea]|uniref:Sulfotransferase n=1 Tax=Aquilegia coerulea TaxID=218851 RepID=A0A2G5C3Q5_AQUCA|nr:hypothetical protein AQUCO_10400005v1 [Aquilegia coerulea]
MDSRQDVLVRPESNEFQELLPSIPSERDAMNLPLHLYKGIWYRAHSLEDMMGFQRHFQALDTDIILATAPKSDTTWLKSVVFAVSHRSQNNKFPDLTSSHDPPRIFATHVPYFMLPESVRTSKCRMIYLCRNPKDIFKSFERFYKGIEMFGPCWEQALEYWKLSTEKPEVLFLKFEDLKADINIQLKRIAEHLGCPFSAEEENRGVIEDIANLCSFHHLSNLEVKKTGEGCFPQVENNAFFRKGEVGDWMNILTPSIVEKLDQVV